MIVAPLRCFENVRHPPMWLRDDATVIDAFLRSRLSPPYGWGIPQCVRVRMLPTWKIHISVPRIAPTLSIMGILPYVR